MWRERASPNRAQSARIRLGRLGTATMLAIVLGSGFAPSVFAIEAPDWTGPKDLEPKYRRDWYSCLTEAEKTVPPIGVNAGGSQGLAGVALAVKARNRSVTDVVSACMRARGYTWTSGQKD